MGKYWGNGKITGEMGNLEKMWGGVGENSKPAGDGCHLLLAGIVDY